MTSTSEEDAMIQLEASIEWVYEGKLNFSSPARPGPDQPTCSNRACGGKVGEGSGHCSQCKGSWYCCKKCQVQDWKMGHKGLCARTKSLVTTGEAPSRATLVRLLRKIRMYAAPFAGAYELATGTAGIVFLQSPNPLLDFCLIEAKCDPLRGFVKHDRAVILNAMSVDEFVASSADPSFAPIATAVQESASALDPLEHYLTVCKFRCGAVMVVKQPWVPVKSVALALASDFKGKDCIQLNIEDES